MSCCKQADLANKGVVASILCADLADKFAAASVWFILTYRIIVFLHWAIFANILNEKVVANAQFGNLFAR